MQTTFISWVNNEDTWLKCAYRSSHFSDSFHIVISNKERVQDDSFCQNILWINDDTIKNIGEAYNKALEYVKGDRLVFFIHQDVILIEPNIVEKVDKCFDDKEVGLVGFIGSKDYSAVPWWSNPARCRGRILQGENLAFWEPYEGEAGVVDALCIAMKERSLMSFSEEYKGAHFAADMDICSRVRFANKKVWISRSLVCHLSGGEIDDNWNESRETFRRQWGM